MNLSVCPIATVAAPAEAVWAVLTTPEEYGEWWRAQTEAVTPPGTAAPGQRITASVRRFGLRRPLTVDVLARDDAAHALDLRTALPFGLVVRNHLVVAPLDARSSRLTFGWDFSFPPGWRGWLWERVPGSVLHRGVEDALHRVQRRAEEREE